MTRRTGLTANAVRVKRERLDIPNPAARSGDYGAPDWTAAVDGLVRELPPLEAAQRTGRTMGGVYKRRRFLGVADRRKDG